MLFKIIIISYSMNSFLFCSLCSWYKCFLLTIAYCLFLLTIAYCFNSGCFFWANLDIFGSENIRGIYQILFSCLFHMCGGCLAVWHASIFNISFHLINSRSRSNLIILALHLKLIIYRILIFNLSKFLLLLASDYTAGDYNDDQEKCNCSGTYDQWYEVVIFFLFSW